MTSGNASYFVDANVLVYAALKDDSRHEISRALLKNTACGALHLSPQILAEFYSTVTNPKRVTVPYSPPEAIEFIETLLSYEQRSHSANFSGRARSLDFSAQSRSGEGPTGF